MRLEQIKLAGFKSFVDPVSFDVPGQRVGVVGPNGCGKSNLIDAVRWVLGESRASELRGESMQDVIFNGSAGRKPAARASVELVFDNSSGRIGGSWGGFAQIAVRRVLARDGQSGYFINQQAVRRRDVHDLFLGTGLGPRAYAIIGQGTISRIIEARPEELRVFLEEAAGVSKYKERRRETASRLADARESLIRVDDIRRELGLQIAHLERQAEVAREYRALTGEREHKQHGVWLLRMDEAKERQHQLAAQAAELAVQLEAQIARQRAVESELEMIRSRHFAAGDALHAAQGSYYECNAQVSRIEAEIQLVTRTRTQLHERIEHTQRLLERAREQHVQAGDGLAGVAEQQAAAGVRASELEQVVSARAELLPAREEQTRALRRQLDEARQQVGQTRQAIELCALHERKARESLEDAVARRARLTAEADGLQAFDPDELDHCREELAIAEEIQTGTAHELDELEAQWRTLEERRQPAQQALREHDAEHARLDGRLNALRQLQERIDSQARIQPWLQRHGLERLSRFFEQIRVEDGWEAALESVLRERVQALAVARLDVVAGMSADAPPAKTGFFSWPSASEAGADVSGVQGPSALRPLTALVQSADPAGAALLHDWLAGCYLAESLDAALAQRGLLPHGGCFVVRDGHVVRRHSVEMYAADTESEGLLARRHEIDNLQRQLRARELIAETARTEAARLEHDVAARLAALEQARGRRLQEQARVSALRMDVQRLEQQRSATASNRERIEAELAELAQRIGEQEEIIARQTDEFETLDLELAEHQDRAETLRFELDEAERLLDEQRQALQRDEREAQEAAFAVRSAEAAMLRLREQMAQALVQQEQARTDLAGLQAQADELTAAAAREALQTALDARVRAEQDLAAARATLDELGDALRRHEDARLEAERAQEPLRERLGGLQLDEQAARLAAAQHEQSLSQAGLDEEAIAALRASWPQVPRVSWLQAELTRLSKAIEALGAVNLAALDELTQAGERKGFLDAQAHDLEEAIGTLEDAIRKIDRETRELLQHTYDVVNSHFGRLFPELFGGGEARLVLTGEEILDAGIQVLAQPPGKRNASIQLLSGGEKALTAIALVFAMFELNPAPFCLLDEVDAPLDDANTERYCDMVRRMSAQTQFLFITHNKIAMELAQQLVGVTMQEQGVSRIVAVDLDDAARYAEAA